MSEQSIPAEQLQRVLEQHIADHPGADHAVLTVERGYGRNAGLESSDWIVTLSYTNLSTRDLRFPDDEPAQDAPESEWEAWYDRAVWVETPDYKPGLHAVYGVLDGHTTLWMD